MTDESPDQLWADAKGERYRAYYSEDPVVAKAMIENAERLERAARAAGYVPEWESPEWCRDGVHNWMAYIDDEVAEMWDTFTPEQKAALYRQAERWADSADYE